MEGDSSTVHMCRWIKFLRVITHNNVYFAAIVIVKNDASAIFCADTYLALRPPQSIAPTPVMEMGTLMAVTVQDTQLRKCAPQHCKCMAVQQDTGVHRWPHAAHLAVCTCFQTARVCPPGS